MKKITFRIFLIFSIILLTGCSGWKRKKQSKIESEIVVIDDKVNTVSSENISEPIEINFDENGNSYEVISGKSIFADDEVISEDSTEPEALSLNKESQNFDLLVDVPIEDNSKYVMLEKDKIHLATLLFEFDQYKNVKNDYIEALNNMIHQIQCMLINNPKLKIIIEGHACNSCGSERYNLNLSNSRAISIKDKLFNNTTINSDNVSVFGCGTSHLIVHGGRAEQAPNRRVEIFIVQK